MPPRPKIISFLDSRPNPRHDESRHRRNAGPSFQRITKSIIRSIHQERALSSREPERSTRQVLAGNTAKGRSLTVFYGKGCAKFQKTCVTRTAGKGKEQFMPPLFCKPSLL